jgi:hypothetical protein
MASDTTDRGDDCQKSRVQEHFRFRFVSRGERANRLTWLSVRALLWCHPGVRIAVVDGNDEPQLAPEDFPGAELVHIAPGNDMVAAKVGRGSRKHVFYWRHSPEVLAALPHDTKFSVYMDSDIILMRPMDLPSLLGPLERGRIGASVDESTLAYSGLLQGRAHVLSPLHAVPGGGGPLLQGGLVFSPTIDDGDLYQEFWRLAECAAAENVIELLPFDDMTLLTLLLTRGGRLWERWLPLGHEWNYITAADKEPGAFAVGAHYGGFRAKALVLEESIRFTTSDSPVDAWGSTLSEIVDGRCSFSRGVICGAPEGLYVRHRVVSPFALSWRVPAGCQAVTIEVCAERGCLGPILLYIDGSCRGRIGDEGLTHACYELCLDGGRVVTVIAAPYAGSDGGEVDVRRSFSTGGGYSG